MKFLGHDIKAAILDMDGTLIDSTGIWHEIDVAFFAKRGLALPKDYAQHIVHLGLTEAANYTKKTYHLPDDPQDIILEWREMSLEMYRDKIPLKEGALELLELLKKNNVKMSIATANDEELYRPCIERLGIAKYFDYIADVNDVKEGKHSVKIYAFLAEKMSSTPESTLVLEDMPTCIKTCHDNGFVTVAVYDHSSEDFDDEKKANSDLYIKNLKELIKELE